MLGSPSHLGGLALAAALTALGGGDGGGGTGKLGALALGLLWALPSTDAHNWITSPGRGNEAGENNGFNGFQSPPGPQRTARVHVQASFDDPCPPPRRAALCYFC